MFYNTPFFGNVKSYVISSSISASNISISIIYRLVYLIKMETLLIVDWLLIPTDSIRTTRYFRVGCRLHTTIFCSQFTLYTKMY